jgi:hypothetical protein
MGPSYILDHIYIQILSKGMNKPWSTWKIAVSEKKFAYIIKAEVLWRWRQHIPRKRR